MHRTWCTKSYVTRGAQVLSHQDLHTYSTLQYSIYCTLQYSTLQYIDAKDLESVRHQRGTSPKSSERHTYLTLHYNTVHYIPIHFSIFFNLFNCLKILSVYKSKEKNGKSQIFVKYFFWRWAQVLSHHFFNDWLEDFDPTTG